MIPFCENTRSELFYRDLFPHWWKWMSSRNSWLTSGFHVLKRGMLQNIPLTSSCQWEQLQSLDHQRLAKPVLSCSNDGEGGVWGELKNGWKLPFWVLKALLIQKPQPGRRMLSGDCSLYTSYVWAQLTWINLSRLLVLWYILGSIERGQTLHGVAECCDWGMVRCYGISNSETQSRPGQPGPWEADGWDGAWQWARVSQVKGDRERLVVTNSRNWRCLGGTSVCHRQCAKQKTGEMRSFWSTFYSTLRNVDFPQGQWGTGTQTCILEYPFWFQEDRRLNEAERSLVGW